jgi:ring-1,2-phenylacetyl-CoA epoxidase subunit PaaD
MVTIQHRQPVIPTSGRNLTEANEIPRSARNDNAVVTVNEVYKVLQQVMDPEIPVLSIVDLGMITDVEVVDGLVTVKMIPTFTACPAIRHIKESIVSTLSANGIENALVVVDDSISWNSNRLTDNARVVLEKFGLGLPQKSCDDITPEMLEEAACPFCKSSNTTMNSMFGSTLCRSIHYCFDCKQKFERFKPVV